MNIKMIFADHIESWDTRADGTATTTHAALEVNDGELKLWSDLHFDKTDEREAHSETGTKAILADLGPDAPGTIPEYLDALGERNDLLRFDVDGEAIWTAQPDLENDEEIVQSVRDATDQIRLEMEAATHNPMLDIEDEDEGEDDDE